MGEFIIIEGENIFESATRIGLYFDTPKGSLTVYDIWRLPIQGGSVNLNGILVGLHHTLREEDTEVVSFIPEEAEAGVGKIYDQKAMNKLRFDIVKHIFDIKYKEQQDLKLRKEKMREKQELLGILADQKAQALRNLTPEELQKRIDELNA